MVRRITKACFRALGALCAGGEGGRSLTLAVLGGLGGCLGPRDGARIGPEGELAGISPELMGTFAEVGKDLYALGLVSSHGGNLSVRVGHEMWISGTGTMLGRLRERHISFVRPDGAYEGPPPSSDTMLHTAIYALGGAGAVVHAHPRHAIAMTFESDRFVPPDFEGQHFLEDVPVIAQGPNHVAQIAGALQTRRVAVLQGHGAYARGQTLWEALHWITALEESAHIGWLRGAQRG